MGEFAPGNQGSELAGGEMPAGLSTAPFEPDSPGTHVVLNPDCQKAQNIFAESVRKILDFEPTDVRKVVARDESMRRCAELIAIRDKTFAPSRPPSSIVLFFRRVGNKMPHRITNGNE